MIRRGVYVMVLAVLALCLSALPAAAKGGSETVDTITFYFPGNTPRDLPAVLDAVNAKIKDTIKAKVVFYFVPWGDYANKIQSLSAAGDTHEAHFDADWLTAPALAAKGALLKLDDLLPKYAPAIWKATTKAEWNASRIGGNIVAIGWRWTKSNRQTVAIRQDLYEKYGLKKFDTVNGDVFTLDDYEKFLQKVKDNEPGMLPIGVQGNPSVSQWSFLGGYAQLNMLWNVVFRWDDPSMKLIDMEQTDHYKAMVQRYRSWYLKGYIEKDVLAQKEDPLALAVAGKAASIMYAQDSVPVLNKSVMGTHPTWKFQAYLFDTDKVADLVGPLGNAVVFNANGAHPEKALAFWDWMHKSQANYDLVMYGIEGKDFTLRADGAVSLPTGVNLDDSPYMGWHGRWAAYWPEFERASAEDPPGFKAELLKGTYINEKQHPAAGFQADTSPIKNELAQRMALRNDLGVKLELGVVDPATNLADYLAKQKEAGIDKVLAELQSQLNAWKASQK
jgi:putative aldouronate transport system substrate-binding protein